MSRVQQNKTFQIERYTFDQHNLDLLSEGVWLKELWPIVYILSSASRKKVYVGESASAATRLATHLNNAEKGLLEHLHLITSPHFHKSATLDIESSLIRYLQADAAHGKHKVINSNLGMVFHNYYEREDYQILFAEIWRKLRQEKIAIRDLQAIDNSDLFKYSPYKALSPDQYQSIFQMIGVLREPSPATAIVEGAAGTGKTVLAIFMIKLLVTPFEELYNNDTEIGEEEFSAERILITKLKTDYPSPKVALVVPMVSLRNTLKAVFKLIEGLSAKMVIGPSEVVGGNYDILIVDEAHRLKQRQSLTSYGSFDQNNNQLGLGREGTELDWILMNSKKQIFFYDPKQSIKPSDVDKSRFLALQASSKVIKLHSQLRVKGGDDYISYVEKLLSVSLPKNAPMFKQKGYEFLFFDHIADLAKTIAKKEKEFQLSRMIAGYSWEWKSKKEPTSMDIELEGIHFQWNQEYDRWINSRNAVKEIGCIHTTQGYDLNYAGVIFGNEITYNPKTDQLEIDRKQFYDKKTKAGITDAELKAYILNIYQTMLYRGIKGVFVYACDPELKAYFKKHIPSFK